MSYDKTNDFKQIQADVLTIDTDDNELISNLKKLKTDNKSITKAINALNEQLGNAQTSASDAVQRVVALEQTQAEAITILQQRISELETQLGGGGSSSTGDDVDKPVDNPVGHVEHVYGMVLVQEGNKSGTWARINKNYETVEFSPEHGTWAGMHTVMNDTYGEFVEIPVTYVKTETLTDGPYAGKNCWWTADGPEDGFHVHPAFIGQDGQPHNLQVASWITSHKNNVPFSEDKGDSSDGYWNSISYNTVHAKGWMTGGCRPYNIYDHHFLARMMLTEFGAPDVQVQTVDGVTWNGVNRISYHGIHDPFGTANMKEDFWLDGLTTLNGTYQVLAPDGSGNMVETGISCPNASIWPVNCLVDQANGIDFGDLFIANMANSTEDSGSFADYQALYSGYAFLARWVTSRYQGAFYLLGTKPEFKNSSLGWRVVLCS